MNKPLDDMTLYGNGRLLFLRFRINIEENVVVVLICNFHRRQGESLGAFLLHYLEEISPLS